ncbi:MAG TPA: M48 family metallopeptidase [Pyrinomonadaceae bacterium]|nr:M48 family metallopeptidase [Pyrinomonadaceae bacterium]
MNEEKFSALVERLEDYAQEQPTSYKVRVGLLAALGYAYIFTVVAILLLVVATVLVYVRFNWFVIKLLWIPLVLVGVALKSLWVSFPEPEGLHLNHEDAPALFDLVREIEGAVQSPHVHHILLTDEFNAAVVQLPRLGFFGWQKNYLLVGLPLMQALSPEQFRAVIAHELGHLSGAHSRFAGWIYRVRQTWIQLVTRLHAEGRYGSFIFERFLDWYAPFFNAYSFVLARRQEYEADARAAELAGREHAAQALINLELKGRFISEDFWPKFYRQAGAVAEPPPDVFTRFVSAMRQGLSQDVARKWFLQGMAVQTGYEDTHPSLAARLAAMGYSVSPSQENAYQEQLLSSTIAGEENAAQFYLRVPVIDSFQSSRNRWWREQIGQAWRERYRTVQEAQKRLLKLEEKEATEKLTPDEEWELVGCLAETQGAEATLPRLRRILDAEPNHVRANFALGQILLEQDDETGLKYLEKAMALEKETLLPGCQLIYLFLKGRGSDTEAEQYRLRVVEHFKTMQATA